MQGRGELHLTILLENMRREGYELAVSRPQVLTKIVDGVVHEPYEALTVDIEESHQGARDGGAGHPPRRADRHGQWTAAAARASNIACRPAGSSASRASS